MPCDSVTTIRPELDRVHKAVLAEALKALGFTAIQRTKFDRQQKWYRGNQSVEVRDEGQVLVTAADPTLLTEEVKRACSVEVVKAAAAKSNWRIEWTAPGKAVVTRATY